MSKSSSSSSKSSRTKRPKFPTLWYKPKNRKEHRKTTAKKFINREQVRALIACELGKKMARSCGIFIADNRYYCPPIEDAKEIITASDIHRRSFVAETFDCDDFAIALKAHFAEAGYKNGRRRAAHAFGVVWGSLPTTHALNWMINDDLKLRLIEPQANKIFLPRSTDKDIHFMLM